MGISELRNDRYGQAINSFSQAIHYNPQLSEAYFYRGVAHYLQKRYPEALANFNQALTMGIGDPLLSPSLMNRAATLVKLGNHRQAIEDLKLMRQVISKNLYDYADKAIAQIYLDLGDRKSAIATLEKLAAHYYREKQTNAYETTIDAIKRIRAGRNYGYHWGLHPNSYGYTSLCP
ncbi:hypothetical protein NIES2119_10000 [[Phormidium ambiguum] IAM M-71]|uniref:Uncharacterized protein n=2 Tax=[Phormidium ambiguum] IAM M-71 TaxID=454136 RepID=A0A1U7IMB1_9CYAN|nr:hypothetical protein NIES2119_10000 [Phormidium ambiguum IAM M-71]